MKTSATPTIHGVHAALSILLTTGCSDRQSASSQPTQTVNAKEDLALKELGAKVGISFLTNTVLVYSGDGGGREPSHQFYEWAVFSPSPIKMPPMQAIGVKDYLNMPLDDTVKFVQSRMKNWKIEQPQSAFDSSWQTNGFGFSGTLVRSVKGDYLVITQGRAK